MARSAVATPMPAADAATRRQLRPVEANGGTGIHQGGAPGEKALVSPGNLVVDTRQEHGNAVGVRVGIGPRGHEAPQEFAIVDIAEQILRPPDGRSAPLVSVNSPMSNTMS